MTRAQLKSLGASLDTLYERVQLHALKRERAEADEARVLAELLFALVCGRAEVSG